MREFLPGGTDGRREKKERKATRQIAALSRERSHRRAEIAELQHHHGRQYTRHMQIKEGRAERNKLAKNLSGTMKAAARDAWEQQHGARVRPGVTYATAAGGGTGGGGGGAGGGAGSIQAAWAQATEGTTFGGGGGGGYGWGEPIFTTKTFSGGGGGVRSLKKRKKRTRKKRKKKTRRRKKRRKRRKTRRF